MPTPQIKGIVRVRLIRCCAAILGLLSCVATSTAKELPADSVTWCQFDLPPMYIVDGPNAGKGIVDGHVDFLIRHLPEYQHQSQVSNIRRVTEQIRNQEHVVCAGMQKNAEREAFAYFSLPFHATTPPTFVTPRRNIERLKPYLNAAGEVKLAALINGDSMNLGIAFGRSYGRDIDEVLSATKDRPNVLVRSAGTDLTEGLIKMMALKRVDYTIVYGSELRLFTAALVATEDEVVSLPIEGQPRYIPIYIVAPKTEWGRIFTERVNKLLRTYWDDATFRATAFTGMASMQVESVRAILRELKPTTPSTPSRRRPKP